MKIQFIGKSANIKSPDYNGLVVKSFSVQPALPSIHFLDMNGSERSETIQTNRVYTISNYDSVYFSANGKCIIDYELVE